RKRAVIPSTTLGILEVEIAEALRSYKRNDEARATAQMGIADLRRGLAKDPGDGAARGHLSNALFLSGCLAEEAGPFHFALDCFEQRAALCMALDEIKGKFHGLTDLYARLQVLAGRLGAPDQAAQQERARRLRRQILGELLGSRLDAAADVSAAELEMLGH